MANSVIKIEPDCKVPLAMVYILTANAINMQNEKSLVWGHA